MLCPESGNTNSVTKNDVGVQCDLRQGVEDGLHESVCVCVSEALNEDANSCGFMSESETFLVRPDILDFAAIDSEVGCSNNSSMLSDHCDFYDQVMVEDDDGETCLIDGFETTSVSESDSVSMLGNVSGMNEYRNLFAVRVFHENGI